MFKAARNRLVANGALGDRDAPSYLIECLLYNALDRLFALQLATTYIDIVEWLAASQFQGFTTQSGTMNLLGPRPEQRSTEQARRFVSVLQQLWRDGADADQHRER